MTVNLRRILGRPSPLKPQVLQPADLFRLRLELHPRLDLDEADEVLRQRPGASFWIPESEEFILVQPWRNCDEISAIHTFGAFANEDMLVNAVMNHARETGQAGMVAVDLHETRQPSFFQRHGLTRAEEIVTYTRANLHALREPVTPSLLSMTRVEAGTSPLLDAVVDLDHRAFPWFWWNSVLEFEIYLDYPSVEVWAGTIDDEVVAYAGITRYRGWAHLDRIAISPDRQGMGLGRDMLHQIMRQAARRGAQSLALSTQRGNQRSRRLYERSGFVPTPRDDYRIHLASFDDERMLAGLNLANDDTPT